MNPGRGTTCAVCGLVACLCLVAGETLELVQHPLRHDWPGAVAAMEASPQYPDHTHGERYGGDEMDGRAGVEQSPPLSIVSREASIPVGWLTGVAASAAVSWESSSA